MPRNERLRRLARGIMPRIPHEVNWYMDPRTERWVVEAKCAGRWRKVAEHPTYEEAHEQWAALIRGRIAATQAIYHPQGGRNPNRIRELEEGRKD